MLKNKLGYGDAVMSLIVLMLIFDFINGLVILTLGTDLKLSYIKIILVMLFLMQLLTVKMFSIIPSVFISLAIFFVMIHSQISSDYNIVEDISSFVKLLMPVITFLAFYVFNKKGYFKHETIIKCLRYFFYTAMLLISINAFLIILGVSIYQYQFSDVSAGGGGLIASGNELAALLVLLYLPSLSFLILSKSKSIFSITCFIMYGMAMFVGGMKFSMLSFIILTAYCFFYNVRFNMKSFFYSLLIILTLPFVITYTFDFIEPFVSRWEYFYNKFDLLTFLLSGRNLRVEYFFNEIMLNISLGQFIFGFGWGADNDIGFIGYSVYEIDVFDSFYSYGLIGFIISSVIWGGGMIIAIVNFYKAKNLFSKSISLSVMLLFFGSFITGHIWFSGLLGIYLGMLLFFSIILRDQTNESFSFY